VVSPELGPIYRRTVIRAVAGLGEPIELSGGVRGAATHARIRRRHTKVALSAVRAPRGTASSNQSPPPVSPSPREFRGLGTKSRAFRGGLRVDWDLRRDELATNWLGLAIFLGRALMQSDLR